MKKGMIVYRDDFGNPEICLNHSGHGRIHVRLHRETDHSRLPYSQWHLVRPNWFRWMVGDVRECWCANRKPMSLRELAEWPVKHNIWGGGVDCPSKTEFSEEAAALFAATPDAPGRIYEEHPCKTREGSGSICLGTCNAYLSYGLDYSAEPRTMEVHVSVGPCHKDECGTGPFRPNRRLQRAIAQHIHEHGVSRPRKTKAV